MKTSRFQVPLDATPAPTVSPGETARSTVSAVEPSYLMPRSDSGEVTGTPRGGRRLTGNCLTVRYSRRIAGPSAGRVRLVSRLLVSGDGRSVYGRTARSVYGRTARPTVESSAENGRKLQDSKSPWTRHPRYGRFRRCESSTAPGNPYRIPPKSLGSTRKSTPQNCRKLRDFRSPWTRHPRYGRIPRRRPPGIRSVRPAGVSYLTSG